MSTDDDLAQLVAEGANLAVSRSVRHYMPTQEAANSVASELRMPIAMVERSPSLSGSASPARWASCPASRFGVTPTVW
jgi:hypothetical protein